MRRTFTLTLALLSLMWLTASGSVWAVTITGGTGPGGVGTTDGSSNLTLWLKGDNIINGAEPIPDALVTSWYDSSGSGFTATTANPPTYKTSVLNGLPAVRFVDDVLSAANFDNSTDKTIFAISASGDVTVWSPFLMHSNNAGMTYGWVGPSNPNKIYLVEDNVLLEALSSSTFVNDEFSIATGQWDNSGNEIFVNGASEATHFDTVNGTAGQPLFVGARGGTFFDGDIAEIAIYNTAIISAERKIIENALSAKYNVGGTPSGSNNTLGVNDLYAGDLDSNGDYDSEVFGIGQSDGSALSSAGSAGFGIEAISGLDNGDFVLAGHNVESNTELDSRWDRSWYLDNQLGGDEVLTLAFDWSDAGLGSANQGFLGLNYSATDGGPFSPIANGTLVGDTVTFAGLLASDLASGYYTLGLPQVPEPSSFLLLGLGALGVVRLTRRKRKV